MVYFGAFTHALVAVREQILKADLLSNCPYYDYAGCGCESQIIVLIL